MYNRAHGLKKPRLLEDVNYKLVMNQLLISLHICERFHHFFSQKNYAKIYFRRSLWKCFLELVILFQKLNARVGRGQIDRLAFFEKQLILPEDWP